MIEHFDFMLFHPHLFIIGAYVGVVALLVIEILLLTDIRLKKRKEVVICQVLDAESVMRSLGEKVSQKKTRIRTR
jgi:hypothetical protein